MTSLFVLDSVKVNCNDVILTVKNSYTRKEKNITIPIQDFNLKKVCNSMNISIDNYTADKDLYYDYEIDYSEPIEYVIIKEYNNLSTVPYWQLQKSEINEFVYRLLVYKNNSIKRIKHNYSSSSYKDIKLTKKQYLKQVFNEYCLLRKHYFNNEYYKYNEFKNLNKQVVKMIYKYLF